MSVIINQIIIFFILFDVAGAISSTLDLSSYSNGTLRGQSVTISHAVNTTHPILLSSDGSYAWQFFPVPNNTAQRLLVVLSTRYNTTIVWIANRNHPVSSNASLVLDVPSLRLALQDNSHGNSGTANIVWSPGTANISSIVMNSTGNLYILDTQHQIQWQSFDEPTDVMVPGQILRTNHTITSSRAWNDWTAGYYTLKANPGGAVLYATLDAQQDMIPYELINYIYTDSSYNGSLYSVCNLTSILYNTDASGVTLIQDGDTTPECLQAQGGAMASHGISFTTRKLGDGYRFLRLMPNGDIDSFYLDNATAGGLQLDNDFFEGLLMSYCKLPSYCGVNGLCSSTQTCTCPQLFEAIDAADPTQGCRLQTPLNCSIFRQHQFLQVAGADYFANSYTDPRKIVGSPTDCTNLCLDNCSCTAAFFNNGTGACYLYDQVHTMQYGSSPKVTAYLRVASLPPTPTSGQSQFISKKAIIGISIGAAALVLAMVLLVGWISRKLMKATPANPDSDSEEELFLEGLPGLPPRFSYKDLQDATEGFCKLLGKGGSGAVYEGNIPDTSIHNEAEQKLIKVAVKELRVSEFSSIAAASKKQFRSEVATLGSVSHVNLVQLRGFCAEGVHRLLIYEFMENGSLDNWIFNSGKKSSLPWDVRYRIALDTARGLAFLHEECREKVVHLDVKPQNILLDTAFRAKLADFGLSKLMERGENQTVTAMRGTPGYMAPEWFLNMPITDKSDVFSYGMVLLELVGGRKNLNLAVATSDEWYFPAWAVKQAKNDRLLDVIDKQLVAQLHHHLHEQLQAASAEADSHGQQYVDDSEIALDKLQKLINVAFWCIQEDASSRPSMMTVLLMLEEHLQVPPPPLDMAYVPRVRQSRQVGPSSTSTTTSSSRTTVGIISSGGSDIISAVSAR